MFHGTDLESGKIIIESQTMEPSRGDHHWLGDGVYFYKDANYAFRWIVIKYTGNFNNLRAHDYKEIFQDYIILTAELNSDRILNLEAPAVRLFYLEVKDVILKKSEYSERIQIQLNESGFADGVVFNVLFEKMGYNDMFDYVSATFPIAFSNNTGSRLSYIPELQVCVKNADIINHIREFQVKEDFSDYKEFVELYRKTKKGMDSSKDSSKKRRSNKKKNLIIKEERYYSKGGGQNGFHKGITEN